MTNDARRLSHTQTSPIKPSTHPNCLLHCASYPSMKIFAINLQRSAGRLHPHQRMRLNLATHRNSSLQQSAFKKSASATRLPLTDRIGGGVSTSLLMSTSASTPEPSSTWIPTDTSDDQSSLQWFAYDSTTAPYISSGGPQPPACELEFDEKCVIKPLSDNTFDVSTILSAENCEASYISYGIKGVSAGGSTENGASITSGGLLVMGKSGETITIQAYCGDVTAEMQLIIFSCKIDRIEFKSAFPETTDNDGNGIGNIISTVSPDTGEFKPKGRNYQFRGWVCDQLNTELAQKIGTALRLAVWVTVEPKDIEFRIGGKGFDPQLQLEQQPANIWASSTGKSQVVSCNSSGLLPDAVGISKDRIKWGITARGCDPKVEASGSTIPEQTGPHEIFLTLDTPIVVVKYKDNRGVFASNNTIELPNAATVVRMRKVCEELGSGGTGVDDTVENIYDNFPKDEMFDAGATGEIEAHYWDMFDGEKKDCDGLSACFILACSLVGVENGAVRFIYPSATADCLKQKGGINNQNIAVLLKFELGTEEKITSTNEYQGVAEIAGKFWAIVPELTADSPCEMLRQLVPKEKIFISQRWYYAKPIPNTIDKFDWIPFGPKIPPPATCP